MNHLFKIEPLGKLLQKAGLISEPQLEVALYDRYCYEEMRIGEILALRGWIESATADFFAEQWHSILKQSPKKPLGFYLQKAALLSDRQVAIILQEQPRTLIKFGSLAVIKGWIEQQTLDFFLINLFPTEAKKLPFKEQQEYHIYMNKRTIADREDLTIDRSRDYLETIVDEIDYEDIPWID